MADGHFPDVELLRRELATLILEWAGKSVKDDPDGPLSTALTRAVGDAARGAVAEQHQALSADAADRLAEALEQRAKARGLWGVPAWGMTLMAIAAATLFGLGYLLGLQAGRTEDPLPATSPAASAPIAPIAPIVDEPEPPQRSPPVQQPRAQRTEPASAKPATRQAPRELGRPAPAASDATPRTTTQPVGGATPPPATNPAPATTP
ncbi:hypothetical protein [Caulobacter sp.]|uniref:hypothetical protein n=1 Tax=Caulobacter sp. TaxID=78 RepID=UPI001B09A60E|nr:hypothetical protein [Caulobacter sp.]MBO9546325.1 hypothetical protein [Caulobacter sp.]